MVVTVCIGSSCHLKGARPIVERLQTLITQKNLEETVQLKGTFCTGNCMKGVCVSVDDENYSVSPDTVDAFFQKEILGRLNDAAEAKA